MSVCDESCRGCIYASTSSQENEQLTCNYILVTGNRRGCPAGQGCERRIKGQRLSSIDSQIYRGRTINSAKWDDGEKEAQIKTIKGFLEEHQMTYQMLGEACGGVSKSTIKNWARGTNHAKWNVLARAGIVKPGVKEKGPDMP